MFILYTKFSCLLFSADFTELSILDIGITDTETQKK